MKDYEVEVFSYTTSRCVLEAVHTGPDTGSIQVAGRVDAAKAAAQNQDAFSLMLMFPSVYPFNGCPFSRSFELSTFEFYAATKRPVRPPASDGCTAGSRRSGSACMPP